MTLSCSRKGENYQVTHKREKKKKKKTTGSIVLLLVILLVNSMLASLGERGVGFLICSRVVCISSRVHYYIT